MSGFDVAAGVVGMVSLGLQCCKGIATFYGSYKDYGPKMEQLLESTKNCRRVLEIISTITINHGSLNPSASQSIEDCIVACVDALEVVEMRLKKLKPSDKPWKYGHSMQRIFDKSVYCFKETTLLSLAQSLDSAKDDVTRALGILAYLKIEKMDGRLQNGLGDVTTQITGISSEVKDVSTSVALVSSRVGNIDNAVRILPSQLDKLELNVLGEIKEGRRIAEEIPDETILNWITTVKFEERQNTVIKSLHEGTCTWFFEHPKFLDWRDGTNKELWCVGIPGGGKTVLTAAIIRHLRKMINVKDTGLCFIYFSHQTQKEQDLLGILLSLLRQIAKHISPIPDSVRQKYIGLKPNEESLDLENAIILLKSSMLTLSRTLIVIDGLDECEQDIRGDIIDHIRSLSTAMNILVTSRDLPDIRDSFQASPEIFISATDDDMRLYLRDTIKASKTLSRLTGRNSELSLRIIDTICEKAHGMFLYAKLNIGSVVKSINLARVNRALSKMPEDLEATYDMEIEMIQADPDSHDIAMRVLAWIIFATEGRPFTLSELQHAVAIQEYNEFQDEFEEEPFNNFLCPDPLFLLKSCRGFLVLNEEDNTVMWAHYTTREYFNKEKRKSVLFPNAYFEVTQACISYLSLDYSLNFFGGFLNIFHDKFRRGRITFANVNFELATQITLLEHFDMYPLYLFAVVEWGKFASKMETSSDLRCEEMILQLLENETILQHVSRFWNFSSSFRSFDGTSQLYQWLEEYFTKHNKPSSGITLASAFGLARVVSAMAEKGADLNTVDERSYTPLILAIQCQKIEIFKVLLEHNADLNITDHYGNTPLIYVSGGNVPDARMLEILLKLPYKDLNKTNHDGLSALHTASQNAATFKMLLESGADPNIIDKFGRTPLICVANRSRFLWGQPCIDPTCIHKYNIDPNIKDIEGRTALSYAAETSKENLVHALLQVTSEPCLQDLKGMNALMYAALSDSDETTNILKTIVQKVAVDLNITDLEGRNVLKIAAQSSNCKKKIEVLLPFLEDLNQLDQSGQTLITYLATTLTDDSVAALTMLLDQEGIKIDVPDRSGRTPLVNALSKTCKGIRESEDCRSQIVKLLIERGANLEIKDEDGRTPLSLAAGLGNADIFQAFLGHLPDTRKIKCKAGRPPISYAAERGHTKIVEILLSFSDGLPSEPDLWKGTPLEYAAICGHCEIIELILKHEADNIGKTSANIALCYSATHRHVDVLKALLERQDIDVNFSSHADTMTSPLLCAVSAGDLECVKILVDKGASLDTKTQDGQTIIYIAAWRNHLEVVEYLFSKKEVQNQIDTQDALGQTPLLRAISYGDLSMVECLLDHGADTGCMNEDGENAISMSASKGFEDIFAALVKKGANPQLRDKESKCPLMLAAKYGNLTMIKTLIEKYGFDPQSKSADGSTPLYEAVAVGAPEEVIELLLKYKASPDAESEDGFTPLTVAALLGNQRTTELLMSASKYGLSYRNKYNRSSLSIGAELGMLPGIELLLKMGCDINERDETGRSALSWAVQSNPESCLEVVKFMLAQEGVDLESMDNEENTLLDWASSPYGLFFDAWEADNKNTKELVIELLDNALWKIAMERDKVSAEMGKSEEDNEITNTMHAEPLSGLYEEEHVMLEPC
ncbi:hypothetical protein HYALB_00006155 [Hymenoscyphus albidus]|uniref:Nephrocystin 3-like N-terminal domain-containing protein n=1 Tax=Hymenoscyphus albidus TaxID=595503 RepID=A0A9N9Q6G0_9HELO|nr:hypothetical protein HYALB_00006155 [Hymenoscyphus albidus]